MEEPFVGREAELAVLDAALDEARGGRPRVVLVDGPQGIGKTALVAQLLRANRDVRTLRASGDESETLVAYAVVDQLLRVGGVSEPVAVGGAATATDHVGAGARVLELLSGLQQDGPLVIVLDDAQWADAASLKALVFALRRLVADPVLALIVVRPQDVAALPEGVRRLAETRLHVGALAPGDLRALGAAMGLEGFTARAAERLHAHTEGSPLYARALLEELPAETWRAGEGPLPAPESFQAMVARRARDCPAPACALVEAAAVLGLRSPLADAARVAGLDDALEALEDGIAAGLLRARESPGRREVTFAHPLVQAAVYHELGPARRARLHLAAAEVAGDEGAALRHRVAAAPGEDARLAAELEDFAGREAGHGAWAIASSTLIAAARLSATRADRERRVLKAVDALLYAGDVARASAFADEIAAFEAGPLRDCVLGFLAVLSSRPLDAERLLRSAWDRCDPAADAQLAATIARRVALHLLYRLRGEATVEWSRRALALAGDTQAELLPLGIGLGYAGRLAEGLAAVEPALGPEHAGLTVRRVRGWLRLLADDLDGARADLAEESATALGLGAFGVAAFALAHHARAEYYAGAWDDAVVHGERAVAIAADLEHLILRAVSEAVAVAVPAARGDWTVAEEHVARIAAPPDDYENDIAARCLAAALLATARGDHDGVLATLEPVLAIEPREGIDEPGCWPWQDLYADALVSAGRLDDAAAFLPAHEALAAERGRASAIARLARVRGRLEAARGDADAADAAFEAGLAQLERLSMPFERALHELAWGQVLRRRGLRRAASERLLAANERFAELGALPYRERCENELVACGLAPAERRDADRDRLTPQELSVARLVASGLTNRQVAGELMLSIRTVEFHLTRIYSKLGIRSRTQLAAGGLEAVAG